jgi:hypothetical protein
MKAPAKKQPTPAKPEVSDAQLKAAYDLWKKGGISIWGVKAKTKIKARVLVPAFEKLTGKKIKSPAMKLPSKKSAKEEVRRAA